MEKLTSPLNESEYKKIDKYSKVFIIKPSNDMNEFKVLNAKFSEFINELTDKEKSRAWFYLRNISKKDVDYSNDPLSHTKKPASKSFTTKEKIGFINLIIILICAAFILYKCATSESQPKDLGDGTYMLYCQKMIKSNANHPSTVEFNNFKVRIVKRGDEVTVVLPFTAKNSFGVPISNTANCTMDKNGLNRQIFIH